jgi:DNA-binding XRE family transcriptional regulator
VAAALKEGYRGLPGGTTLYRFLQEHRQVPGRSPLRLRRERTGQRGRPPTHIDLPPEVLARYQAGELGVVAVAAWCGVAVATATQVLTRAGLPIRLPGSFHGTQPPLETLVVRRYDAGHSIEGIVREVDLPRHCVRAILRYNRRGRRAAGMARKDRRRLAVRLRHLRRRAGLTQVELVRQSGVSLPTITRLENARQPATRKTIARLAQALGVSPLYLMPARVRRAAR